MRIGSSFKKSDWEEKDQRQGKEYVVKAAGVGGRYFTVDFMILAHTCMYVLEGCMDGKSKYVERTR